MTTTNSLVPIGGGALIMAPVLGGGAALASYGIGDNLCSTNRACPILDVGAAKWGKWGAIAGTVGTLGAIGIASENDGGLIVGAGALGAASGLVGGVAFHGMLNGLDARGSIYAMGHQKFGKWGAFAGAAIGAGIASMTLGTQKS